MLTVLGIGVGLPITFGIARPIASMLFGVKPDDLAVLTMAACALCGVGLAVTIPFDDRVIFVRLLHRAEFSSRLPELPKPSTRSPGLSSSSVAEGSESGGFLARSDSCVAPGYDKGG
jgi:hypothetical protein